MAPKKSKPALSTWAIGTARTPNLLSFTPEGSLGLRQRLGQGWVVDLDSALAPLIAMGAGGWQAPGNHLPGPVISQGMPAKGAGRGRDLRREGWIPSLVLPAGWWWREMPSPPGRDGWSRGPDGAGLNR